VEEGAYYLSNTSVKEISFPFLQRLKTLLPPWNSDSFLFASESPALTVSQCFLDFVVSESGNTPNVTAAFLLQLW